MYSEIFLADFAVFRVCWGISRDFAEIPEFRGSATARNIRSPVDLILQVQLFSVNAGKRGFVILLVDAYKFTQIFILKQANRG